MTVRIYAHRGSSAAFAEHTRAAYLQAIADGADGVECDLFLTADGQIVLHHDDTVDRTSNGTGLVTDHTLAQLRALDFSTWKGVAIPAAYGTVAEQLLTLPELLELLSRAERQVGLALELKYGATFSPELVTATLKTLRAHGWTPESGAAGNAVISFMAFHPAAIEYLAAQVPPTGLCQLLELPEPASDTPKARAAVDQQQATMLAGAALIDDGVAQLAGPGVQYLRARPQDGHRWAEQGRTLRVWTVDSAEDLDYVLSLGVQQVTTNRPAEIRLILDAGGGRL